MGPVPALEEYPHHMARIKGIDGFSFIMIIGLYSFKNHRFHPNRRLMETARDLGHRAILMDPRRIFLKIRGGRHEWGIEGGRTPRDVDVIIPRVGSNIMEFALTTLFHFEQAGIPLVNPHRAVSLACNKFLSLQALASHGFPVLDSEYASNRTNVRHVLSRIKSFPLVVKKNQGRQGKGVFLMTSPEDAGPLIESLLHTGNGVVFQRFIPPEDRRDLRIFVVGDRAVGAMALTPRDGEFRANVHLKGKTEPVRIQPAVKALAVGAAKALGLAIAGVDVIEEKNGDRWVIDVNFSPGFRGLERATGKDIANEILQYIIGSMRRRP